jgi:diguanylate cyclase (GGDEF)-like protein
MPPAPRARQPFVSISNEGFYEVDRETPLLPTASPPAAARDRAVLSRLEGATAGEIFVVPRGGLKVGRGRSVELPVDDEGVSREHASVAFEPGVGWVLTDLGSTNGTFVDGRSASRLVLRDGDVIRFGARSALRFGLVDPQGEELARHLYASSTCDLLTGAFNRRHFEERFQAEVSYAVRHNTELALFLFDLDHFKRINDPHGHAAGDTVLRHVAALVSSRLRMEDVFARYGGEEFAVILRNVDLASAARAADRLRGAVASAHPVHHGTMLSVSISVGCATLAECEVRSCAHLVELADRRLYLAKAAGRNRIATAG